MYFCGISALEFSMLSAHVGSEQFCLGCFGVDFCVDFGALVLDFAARGSSAALV